VKNRVSQFDLRSPTDIWGLEGYDGAEVLVREAGVPIGRLTISKAPGDEVLTAEVLQESVKEAGFTKSTEPLQPDHLVKPSISVVVCTRDRPIALARCLQSLQALRYDNFEVLIVDNASLGSETKELVAQTPFRYVREDRLGLAYARNSGMQAASMEVVAYTDDDVKVDPNWLDGIAFGFRYANVACVTGLVCPLELETPAQVLFEQNGGMGKGFRAKRIDPANLETRSKIATNNICGAGANMAFRREALLELGGFDVHLGVGTPSHGGEDLDIFHRILDRGKVIRYEPGALVWHQHRRSMPALHKQFYDNGRAFGCYLLKILSNRTVPPGAVVKFAFRDWFAGWLVGSLVKRRKGRRPMLVAAEFWGALHSPWAYWKTYRKIPLSSRVS
jgi:glycosyltransferase involved in cell wall biosynthesis